MTTIPFFIEQEINSFDKILSNVMEFNNPIFCVNCHNLSLNPKDLECFAASYLLMNALLMVNQDSKILKLIEITENDHTRKMPMLNALRGLFSSDFSALSNIDKWEEIINKRAPISLPSMKKIRQAVDFINSSEMKAASDAFGKADVFLSVSMDESEDNNYLFNNNKINIFQTNLKTLENDLNIIFTEYFHINESIRAKINSKKHIFYIDIDFEQNNWVSSWLEHLEPILNSKLYASREM